MWHFNENARYVRLPKMLVWGAAEMALRLRAVAALLEDPRAQWQLPNYPYFQFLKNPIIFLPFMGFRLIHIVQRCVCRQNNHEVFIMKIKEVKPQQAVAPRIQVPYCFSSSSHKDLWQTHLSNIFFFIKIPNLFGLEQRISTCLFRPLWSGVEWPFHRGHPRPLKIDIYVTIHNSRKLVMK